jgi:transposase
MSDDYRARLIAARQRLGLSPRQMAARLLTPRQTYEQWEHGGRRTPGVAVIAAESLRERDERARAITAAVSAGDTYEAVAQRYGITSERVRQIAKSQGITSLRRRYAAEARAASAAKREAAREAIAARDAAIIAAVRGGASINAACIKAGLRPGQIPTVSRRLNLGKITRHGRWRTMEPSQ